MGWKKSKEAKKSYYGHLKINIGAFMLLFQKEVAQIVVLLAQTIGPLNIRSISRQ